MFKIDDIKLGSHVKEENIFNIKDLYVCLKNVKYTKDSKYGYSTLEGDVCGITNDSSICELRLNKEEDSYCVYHNTKIYKTLKEKKIEEAINNLSWLVSFLIESWNINYEELNRLSKKCGVFEYIVEYSDYINSTTPGNIEYILRGKLGKNKEAIDVYYLDEYYVHARFEYITEYLLRQLIKDLDISVYDAMHKLLDTKTFKEYADKYDSVTTYGKNDDNKEEQERYYTQLKNELNIC